MRRSIFLMTLLLLLICSNSFAVEIVLITDLENPTSELTEQDAKNIFLGKKMRWDDGSMIVAITQETRAVTNAFSRIIVNMSSTQFSLYWRKAVFTGTGLPPLEVKDDLAMKEMVASKLGSIGYISADALDHTVKKLTVR